jgi:hypothetical protein
MMIPPTIENATHAGPMPDGRKVLDPYAPDEDFTAAQSFLGMLGRGRPAQQAANNTHANERRLVDQLQRLEASLEAERLEANALKQQLEDLRSRLQVAEADWRRLAVAARALSDALELGGGLSTAGNIALGNLRRALGMVP